jgi:hypothetical protein
MNRSQYEESNRFAEDVDRLINGQPVTESSDEAYKADLDLAQRLNKANFVPDPNYKTGLRVRLLNQLNDEKKEVKPMIGKLLRSALVAGVSALLLFVVVFAVSPDVRAASQELVARFVEVDSPLDLLPSSDRPTAPKPGDLDEEVISGADTLPRPSGKPESPAGLLPQIPEAVPTHNLISLEEAQAGLEFTIRMPTVLPEGYSFVGAVPRPELPAGILEGPIEPPDDLPRSEAPQTAMLIFRNADGDVLMLSEVKMLAQVPGDVPLPAGNVQNVTVNGQPAQYVDGMWSENGWVSGGFYQLHWQGADGIMYDLSSTTLTLDTLLTVAESIQ